MKSGWLNRLISQVLCCTLFLQATPIAAGYLSASLDPRDRWVGDEHLAGLVKPELPADVAVHEEPPAPAEQRMAPEPVRRAALQRAEPQTRRIPASRLIDSREGAPAPAVPARPERREEPRVELPPLRPEDLPPFPPGMKGAVLPQSSAAPALKALTSTSLIAGWNLGSVQNEPVDKAPAAVFSSLAGKLTRVFAYDACTPGDPWKVYDPADAVGSDLTQIDQKIGFWAEMTSPAAVPNPGTLAGETAIHLCPGWNLIGFPAEQPRPVRTALSSIEGKYTRVFGFDPADSADPWEVYDVAVPSWVNDLDLMQPGRGYWVLATAETDLTISNNGAEPEVALIAPADLAVVTAPTEVRGTVTSDRLESWTLSYRAHGESESTVFATGTLPVVNGRLGTLDPTLLLNGGYAIELTAEDFNGQIVTISIDVSVEGQMKIGNFTLSFLDLEIPLSGLPIQVYRNYDSRDKRRGDFGIGWTLALRNGTYRNNRQPGDGWQFAEGFLPCLNIGETRSHLTTIRLSDREVYRFKLALASGVPTLGGCFAQAHFNFVDGPVPGATLEILGNAQVLYQNGANFVASPDTLEIFEPQQVRLTTRDGRIFDLDLQQGVTRVEDLNGNTLSVTPGGITHSSGLSVAFHRDGFGRITSIVDPAGGSISYAYDTNGDLASVTDREAHTTRFTYSANHHLLEIEDPLGRKPVRNEYDSSGRLIRTTDAFGKSMALDHQVADRREIVSDRLGHTRLLEYDDRGNVIRELDADSKQTLRTFDQEDRLLTEVDPLGHSTSYTYDSAGDLTSVTDPEGNRTSFTYGSRGEVLTVQDPRGKLTENTYDTRGNLLSISDPLGNVTSFTYDGKGRQLTEKDAEGNVTEAEYDAAGNVIRVTDALGHEAAYTYDANGNLLTRTTHRTTPDGTETLTWSYSYDQAGRLTQTTYPDGTSETASHDALGNVIQKTDKLGRSTQFAWDAAGHLALTTFPDGTSEQVAYDAEGRPVSRRDRGGRTTQFEHDAVGRLVKTIHPDGSYLTKTYDAAGRLVAEADARQGSTAYEYDDADRQTAVINAKGQRTAFGYDAGYNRTSITDAAGRTTTFEYDAGNRLVRIVYPDDTERTVVYDRLSRKIVETDQAGSSTRFGYDAAGRVLTVTDALRQVTRYSYDELGNLVVQTDANSHATRFEHDRLGRLVKRILPLGQFETRTYDAAGNLTSRTDFKGATVTYSHDLDNRVTSRSYPDGTSATFTYTPAGRRASVSDSRGTTTYLYDDRDRLIRITYPSGRGLEYGYDSHGNRTSLAAILGSQTLSTSFAYDSLNRLESVTDPQGRVYTYSYDALGNRASLAFPNGVDTTYGYDALNRLTSLATRSAVGQVVQSYVYTLGAVGNRVRIEEQDGTERSFTYDAIYRLTKETLSGALDYELSFGYDPVGNRLNQVRTDGSGSVSTAYSYDERDRLLSAGGDAYTWEANGNLTGKGGAVYAWDLEDRLVEARKPGGTVITHAYDADGNRVRTEVTPPNGPPSVIEYLIDPTGELSHVVAETDGTSLTAFYVRGDDLLAVIRSTGSRFYHADGLGSIRTLTDEAGNVTDRYSFSAFGELLAHTGSDPNAYLFVGEPLDPNSGFYYLRARWMDPSTGLFLSLDPAPGRIFEPLTLHKYLYTVADPVNNVDPSGRESLPSQLTAVATSVALAIQNMSAQLRVAFAIGGTQVGHLFNAFGKLAESAARQVLGLHPSMIVNTGRAIITGSGRRVIDFFLEVGNSSAWLEVKYSLPRAGEALSRLVGQVQSALSSGQGQVVVWSLREPTLRQLQIVYQAIGQQAGRVQFVHGVEGLFRWMQLYFGSF